MTDFLLANETEIRLGFFVGIFAVMALWEVVAPCRVRSCSRWLRWSSNLGIVVLNSVLLRALVPMAAVGVAVYAHEAGWGLLNQVRIPYGLAIALSVIFLDFVIYLQHVLFHAVPVLWRLHRMHHADLDFDVTTGARFHPIEILLSMGIKLAVVMALGPPVAAVLVFEVLLNATAMFNHGNVHIPRRFDRLLRWFLVTPDMHRIHHSAIPAETNSNFGFELPWWDRLFGTYQDESAQGNLGMTIGLDSFRSRKDLRLDQMLLQPFRGSANHHAVRRH